jgi:hypothetical protein
MTAANALSQEADFASLDEDLVTELEGSAIGKAQLRYLQPGLPREQSRVDRSQDRPQPTDKGASKRVRSLW